VLARLAGNPWLILAVDALAVPRRWRSCASEKRRGTAFEACLNTTHRSAERCALASNAQLRMRQMPTNLCVIQRLRKNTVAKWHRAGAKRME
jgi:hypothetical protein